jgi:hypothetical protein
VDCLWSAKQAVDETNTFEACVKRAIKFGHDTDTTAAVAGGIAGLRHGLQGIPQRWHEGLRGSNLYRPLLDRLLDNRVRVGHRTARALRLLFTGIRAEPELPRTSTRDKLGGRGPHEMPATDSRFNWPGRSSTGSVILPLGHTLLPWLQPIRLPEVDLSPKGELHITLLSTREADEVSRSAPKSEWEEIFEQQPWRLELTGQAFLLGEDKPFGKAWSVVAELEDASVNAFRRALSQASGVSLPATLPHVTLWVAGGDRGIGLGSRAEFNQRMVREMRLESLLPSLNEDSQV